MLRNSCCYSDGEVQKKHLYWKQVEILILVYENKTVSCGLVAKNAGSVGSSTQGGVLSLIQIVLRWLECVDWFTLPANHLLQQCFTKSSLSKESLMTPASPHLVC